MQTVEEVSRKMHASRDMADACDLILNLNRELEKLRTEFDRQAQTIVERDATIQDLAKQLAEAKLATTPPEAA